MGGDAVREISLGDLGEVDIKVNSARVAFHADGSIDFFTNDAVRLHPLDGAECRRTGIANQLKPGDRMPDRTIFAGISPDTGDAMYVTPADGPGRMTFNKAARYAADLDAHDHHDWRLPRLSELNEIRKNRNEGALKGTFNESSDSGFAHWYWSCTEDREDPSFVYGVDFTDGGGGWDPKDGNSLSSRPLRTEPRP